MPDISMCDDAKCPAKDGCYRFTAKPDLMQSYGRYERKEDAEKCPSFWPVTPSGAAAMINVPTFPRPTRL